MVSDKPSVFAGKWDNHKQMCVPKLSLQSPSYEVTFPLVCLALSCYSPHGLGAVWAIHVWINMNKLNVFDGLFCCWFPKVMASASWEADRGLTDRRHRLACHYWLSKARSLWKAQRHRVGIGIETHIYLFGFPNLKGWEHERDRDRGQAFIKPL